jgi:hypothetical protein
MRGGNGAGGVGDGDSGSYRAVILYDSTDGA